MRYGQEGGTQESGMKEHALFTLPGALLTGEPGLGDNGADNESKSWS
jgi:hypothetical protein